MTATETKRRQRTKTAGKVIEGPPAGTDLSHIVKPLRPFAVHVARLSADSQNPQLHEERNLVAITDSMRRFGQDQPLIYLREDGVINGVDDFIVRTLCQGQESFTGFLRDSEVVVGKRVWLKHEKVLLSRRS